MQERVENSYRSILKGTSIFGSVQIFQILINLIRGKFVAMFLGPEGMGVSSLFTTSANSITRFASLGLNLSFMKEVAANKDNNEHVSHVMHVASILIQFTALLGAVLCLILAPQLSLWSFGSSDYTWQYMLLSVSIYLSVRGMGEMSLLQGLHQIKLLSVTSLIGALAGLIIGIPLYYFFRDKGIVPAMIILSLTTYICYSYGLQKTRPKVKVNFRRQIHIPLVKRMLLTGVILLASSLINTLFTYVINIYIRQWGNMDDVGLFNAANSITLQYAAVVFTAMAMDYFPRLSAVSTDNTAMQLIINRQSEIVALIATPMSILLIAIVPWVIKILLTPEFFSVTEVMRWLSFAILLKAIAYPLGYIAFAKDNKRLFFWLEGVGCNILYLSLSLIFYKLYGFIGLGYAAVIEQGACIILYLLVNFKAYGICLSRRATLETGLGILLGAAAFIASISFENSVGFLCAIIIFVVSSIVSFHKLRTRIKA